MLDCIGRIEAYCTDGRDAFLEDRKTQDAVLRNLEVLGEAAKGVSDGLRRRHPGIRWKDMAGMRDRLIHDYPGVDLAIVWRAVAVELPKLRGQLQAIAEAGR